MTQKTIDILNNLNKQFYDQTGSVVWNQKQDYYWEGWYQLTRLINESEKLVLIKNNEESMDKVPLDKDKVRLVPLAINSSKRLATQKSNKQFATTNSNTYKILDLGCGNARFANFINSQLTSQQVQKIEYLGVDFSVNFLEQSRGNSQQNFAKFELKQMDILNQFNLLRDSKFDLIVMFGLIHHIPSLQVRNQFFKSIVELVNPGGMLIFTTWQYLDTPRLIKRVVDPKTETGQHVYSRLGIKKTDLEVGDNILDWVKKVFSYRYSHYFCEDEIQGFISDNNIEIINEYVCDGRDSKRNKYFICKVKDG